MTITITQATIKDILELQRLGKQTFIETFSEHNSKEDMEQYLTSSFNLETLINQLENSNSTFYFAQENQNKIGYLKINLGPAQTEFF